MEESLIMTAGYKLFVLKIAAWDHAR